MPPIHILHRDVNEDRVREHLLQTGGERYSDDEAGKAALTTDTEAIMDAHRQRGQWLDSLDPLSRMQAEREPFISHEGDTDATEATDSERGSW